MSRKSISMAHSNLFQHVSFLHLQAWTRPAPTWTQIRTSFAGRSVRRSSTSKPVTWQPAMGYEATRQPSSKSSSPVIAKRLPKQTFAETKTPLPISPRPPAVGYATTKQAYGKSSSPAIAKGSPKQTTAENKTPFPVSPRQPAVGYVTTKQAYSKPSSPIAAKKLPKQTSPEIETSLPASTQPPTLGYKPTKPPNSSKFSVSTSNKQSPSVRTVVNQTTNRTSPSLPPKPPSVTAKGKASPSAQPSPPASNACNSSSTSAGWQPDSSGTGGTSVPTPATASLGSAPESNPESEATDEADLSHLPLQERERIRAEQARKKFPRTSAEYKKLARYVTALMVAIPLVLWSSLELAKEFR